HKSKYLAGFHVPETEIPLPASAGDAGEIARIFAAHRELAVGGGLLVSNPVSEGLERASLDEWLDIAHRETSAAGPAGREITPFLLARLAELSGGQTVEVNLRLLRENARIAAEIAGELCRLRESTRIGANDE